MKKKLISEVINVNEINSVKNLLEESMQLKSNLILKLLKLLKQTNDHSDRKDIALFIVDNFRDKRILPALIALIKKPELQMHNADLVYACSEYPDTKSHLRFFVDLVITGDFHVSWNAYQTIINMRGDFEKRKCNEMIKKLSNAISKNDEEKNDIIKALIARFEKFK